MGLKVTKYLELRDLMNLFVPGCAFETDNEGQLIIYTGKRVDDNGELVYVSDD